MQIHHPEKPFERYADDIVVHCKTEKQALFVLKMIQQRMTDCKLTLHPAKTKIVNLRGITEKKYPRSFDFLGFTIRPLWAKTSKGFKLMVSCFMSTKSKTRVLAKFKSFHIHKWRKPIELIAKKTKAGSTRCDKLLLQVLDSAYTSGMVSIKSTLIKVGTMGERPVQEGSRKVA